MADATAARRKVSVPWGYRFFEAVPLPPIGVGVALALALLAAYFGVEVATGRLNGTLGRDDSNRILRGMSIVLVLLAYLPTAQVYLARWTRRHVEALGPLLHDPVSAPAASMAAVDSGWGRTAGATGSLLFVALFLLLPLDVEEYTRFDYWNFENALAWLLLPFLGWLTARLAHALVADAGAVSRMASDLRRIDLLDLRPLAPFVQQGLGSALLVMIFLAIGMAGLVGQEPELPGAVVATSALVVVGLAALLLPVLGVHRRIRDEKRAQLQTLRGLIDAGLEVVLLDAAEADRIAARLPGLLALEARLDSVREWPFDVSSLLRFGFYVTLGLGSWLGAAAVERLLDRVLH